MHGPDASDFAKQSGVRDLGMDGLYSFSKMKQEHPFLNSKNRRLLE